MIKGILNHYGFYKIDQLEVGGMCGLCGAAMPKHIYYKNTNDHWCDIGICDECRK